MIENRADKSIDLQLRCTQADLASVLNPLGDLFAWRAACSSSLPAAWVFVLTGLRLNTVGACKLPDVLWHHRLDSCRVLLSERHDRLDRFHLDPGARKLKPARSDSRHQPANDRSEPIGHAPQGQAAGSLEQILMKSFNGAAALSGLCRCGQVNLTL